MYQQLTLSCLGSISGNPSDGCRFGYPELDSCVLQVSCSHHIVNELSPDGGHRYLSITTAPNVHIAEPTAGMDVI